MPTQKNITASNLVNGVYTPVPSDRNKHLMFYVGAIIELKKSSLSYIDDEFEVTQMGTGAVSFVDNSNTGDIRCYSETIGATSWKLGGQYASASVKKVDSVQYLLTGNLI